jgi:hypothetical protein
MFEPHSILNTENLCCFEICKEVYNCRWRLGLKEDAVCTPAVAGAGDVTAEMALCAYLTGERATDIGYSRCCLASSDSQTLSSFLTSEIRLYRCRYTMSRCAQKVVMPQ